MDAATSGKVRDILQTAINKAIDASGTGVEHITVTDATPGTFKFESGSVGNNSKVQLNIGATDGLAKLADGTTAVGSNSILDIFAGNSTEMSGGAVADVSGANKVLDALAATDKFQLSIGGHTMEITSPVGATNTDANTYATALETAINAKITAYNTAAGFTSEDQKLKM